MKIGCKILLGDKLEWLIDKITLGRGSYWSYIIAVEWLGFKSCGCEERRIAMNKWTCKEYKDE